MEQSVTEPKLIGIPSDMMVDWWATIEPTVETACARSGGRYGASDILEYARDGRMQIWVVMEEHEMLSLTITEIVNFPKFRECRLLACTGSDYKRWVHLLSIIEEWAVSVGCRKMLAITRLGWEKVLSDYKKTHIYLEKDLGNVH